MARNAFLILLAAGSTTACSLAEFAGNTTVHVLKEATAAFDEESDVWLARAAATSNLKFFEGVLKATPDNEDLLVMTGKNYALYAFAFLEDDLEQHEPFTPEYDALKARASDFYKRAIGYETRRMAQDFDDFERALEGRSERLGQILDECDEDHVAPLYWLAYAWGSYINLNNDDPAVLADLPKAKRIMGWVRAKDGSYHNGGPHLFFGVLDMALGRGLGANPEASKAAFEQGLAVSGGKFLMGKAFYARAWMKTMNDRAGYVRLLTEVVETPADVMPSQRLANELAKKRAARWLAEADHLFDADDAPADDAPAQEPPADDAAPTIENP